MRLNKMLDYSFFGLFGLGMALVWSIFVGWGLNSLFPNSNPAIGLGPRELLPQGFHSFYWGHLFINAVS